MSGQAWLFVALVLAVNAGLALPRGAFRLAPGPRLRDALLPGLLVVAVLALVQYPLNRRVPNGDFVLDDLERIDTAFHVAVTWEVATSWPPQTPGLAGVPLGYHLGPHLIRAMALRLLGIHPYDAVYRFDVTLWALALVLALQAGARALGGGRLAQTLAGFAPLFGDFSWLFAADPLARWWSELFGGNLLVCLLFANSLIPALALALGATIALGRHRAGEGSGYLTLAVALAVAVPYFKVFVAAPLLVGLAAALLANRERAPILAVAAPCALATALLALGPAARSVAVLFDPLAPLARTRELLELPALGGARLLGFLLPWLVAALGVRIVALPGALRALRAPAVAPPTLAAMALIGWPVALLLRVTADGQFNETVYFTNLSGALLWLFTALALERLVLAGARSLPLLLALGVLALPSSVELLARKWATPPDVIPARVFEALDRLAAVSRPGDVVLMRPYSRFPPPPVVFIGRRVPFTQYLPYLRQFAPGSEVRARSLALRAFFRAETEGEARSAARALRARYAFFFGSEAMSAGAKALLEPLYLKKETSLYRVRDE